jgi:hypothetical protein
MNIDIFDFVPINSMVPSLEYEIHGRTDKNIVLGGGEQEPIDSV